MYKLNLQNINKTRPLTYHPGDVAVYFGTERYPYKIFVKNPAKKENYEEYISRKYSRYYMSCWVITIDPISYVKEKDDKFIEFKDILMQYLLDEHLIDQDYNIIAVCQNAYHTGLHCHFTILSHEPLSTEVKLSLNKKFNRQFEILFENNKIENYSFSAVYQTIKSTCSYINYLQSEDKGTFYAICSNKDMGNLFLYFNRNVIFPSGSNPKKLKIANNTRIFSDNDIVLFFMQKLHNNIVDYNEVLQDPNVHRFLHLSNLKMVWENCLTQFKASLTHEKNLVYIIDQINETLKENEKLCPCAMLDLLLYQSIDTLDFSRYFLTWLFGLGHIQKKNTLLFKGPPDSGKSYLARIIWELFYCNQRIINDGLFSFAPAPGAGCLLWEETHISPELADMTKLIMEGNPSVAVAIKNKASQTLNKRIPLIITNNKEMGVYCMDAQSAFDARCFKFLFKHRIPSPCTNKVHTCDFVYPLDSPNCVYRRTGSINSEVHEYQDVSEDSILNCTKFHGLTKHSVLSFIVFAINFIPYFLNDIDHTLYNLDTWKKIHNLQDLRKHLCSNCMNIANYHYD